jgi:cyclophilin family peptidyl-prolyl cis-trans isomerase
MRSWLDRLYSLALCCSLGFAGCGKKPAESSPPTRSIKPPEPITKTSEPARPAGYDRLHQSFAQATRQVPPPDQRPPDRTITGKATGKIYGEVLRLWDTIKFMNPDGTRIHYSATIETERGTLTLDLDDEHAPNHVRNFIALSRAGYYDGLTFDTIHHEEINLDTRGQYEEIEAGCPLGTGEPSANTIGYWLNPEINEGVSHQEGTVGACRGYEKDSAACKFYITLSKSPYLDGHYTLFGKVTSGLEVARQIFLQPVVLDDADKDGARRPLNPVVIRKVTIQTR